MSPRGTVEVLDDYPYWVAKKYGYFGDIETTLEPGPPDATATVKLVDQNQPDMGYPSPGVFSLALEQGLPGQEVIKSKESWEPLQEVNELVFDLVRLLHDLTVSPSKNPPALMDKAVLLQ